MADDNRSKKGRHPVMIHTRSIDRMVAKKNMRKRYSQFTKSGKDKYGNPIHNRYHSKKGADHRVAPDREKQSYFAAQWRRYVPD